MATRRHPALPTLALAAALGATALAATAAAEHAAAHQVDSHNVSASSAGWGDLKDWNTMVPEGGRPARS
jgi:hypothetical protein